MTNVDYAEFAPRPKYEKTTTPRKNARRINPSKQKARPWRVGIPFTNREVNVPGLATVAGVATAAAVALGGIRGDNRQVQAEVLPNNPIAQGKADLKSVGVLVEPVSKIQPNGVVVEPIKKRETPFDNRSNLNQKEQQVTDEDIQKLIDAAPDGLKEKAKETVPLVVKAFRQKGIATRENIAFALANVEYEAFYDLSREEVNGKVQARRYGYDGGENYYGRGGFMFTHRYNYEKFGKKIGVDLVSNPELARDPEISAKIMAEFMINEEIVYLVKNGRLEEARKKVVGNYSDDDENNKRVTRYIINRDKSYLDSMNR